MSYGTAVIDVMRALDWWMDEGAEIDKLLNNRDFVALDCDGWWHTLYSTPKLKSFVFRQFTSSPKDAASFAINSNEGVQQGDRHCRPIQVSE